MKTEQEQIETMAKKMQKCYEKNGLLNFKWFAETLIKAGYGDVSEYKAEIERLKSEFKQAKIDVLKELRKRIEIATDTYFNVDGGYCLAECVMNDIDELIKEAQND